MQSGSGFQDVFGASFAEKAMAAERGKVFSGEESAYFSCFGFALGKRL